MIEKRVIAFDIGNKRIGVAVSDPFNEYAMPCETYNRTGSFRADVQAIAKIAEERGVGVIVCGIPYNFDGTESIQTEKTRDFIAALEAQTKLPIVLEDERFTTMQARETQIAGGIKLGERKKTIDSIAASYILESYLIREKQKNKKAEETTLKNKEIYGYKGKIIDLETDEGELSLYCYLVYEAEGTTYLLVQSADAEEGEEKRFVAVYEYENETFRCVSLFYCEEEFDYKGKTYRAFSVDGDEEETEINILEVITDEETGKEYLAWLDDEDTLDEVFAEFCNLYENFEDGDEALSLDKE